MPNDPTETIRRELVNEINNQPNERQALEAKHGQVWDGNQLREDFSVEGFLAPCVIVTRKRDSVRGTLFFQHTPRLYYGFEPDRK